ncbi:MMPL family transporter [Acetobacter sp.]|jgi:hopanoid biosynthesis associated RND transporter like protein HpnN|uniref:MMPL family transporter n=1 Tax=Acetobacter sp. TaxID=440 RepID=UPI0025C5E809|nr:MMPL family transporter [Acetobacter sp.]MCH4089747.1 MMPL family transporter [Acetobacter sp.]MCI1298443.1 MMPL family transporter [Acetobacter sp.]MCI1316398.1 MMPL family transporter [Acetobacter sp.]
MISIFIGRLIVFCAKRASLVVALFMLLAATSVWVSYNYLGVTTDTDKMLSDRLAWKKRSDMMGKLFPQKDNLLVAVIEADLPEEGRATARALADRLSGDHEHFNYIRLPDDNAYLNRNGLMFLDQKALAKVLDDTVAAQPFLGALAADPSARGLFDALGLIAEGVKRGQANLAGFQAPLNGFANNLEAAANGHPEFLSWQQLLAGNLTDLAGRYQFVMTQPKLDYGSFQPGGAASNTIRAAAKDLEFVQSGHAHVYLTGDVQISDEEFATVADGMVAGLLGSLALVILWLTLAVHTWRVIVPIVITLITGLLLTTGFAAVAVGTLNLISVAFAILFVGIAVDFAIQFSVRLRGQQPTQSGEAGLEEALFKTGEETGHQILVAALATAAGFLAFTPTAFLGVAELGLIAGIGMLVAFVCTILLLPALLRLFRPSMDHARTGYAFMKPVDRMIRHWRKPLLAIFAVIAVVGAVLIPNLKFDGDPLHTKDPRSEGMRTLHLLMSNPVSSPYSAEYLAPNLDTAKAVAEKAGKLPGVHDAMWLGSYVPEDQDAKLALIQDAAQILIPGLTAQSPQPAPDAAAIKASAASAASALSGILDSLAPTDPLRRIQAALAKLATAPDALALRANDALVRFLPMQLDTLKDVLSAQPVTLNDVPDIIKRDYLLPDGRALVEIHPSGLMSQPGALHSFVKTVRPLSPEMAGSAVDIVESAKTIVGAFKTAAISAIIMIAIILLFALRKVLDMGLVLAPLLLSALMTVILIVTVPETLNFANIIALPLLLGVGVSFNIYFVMNWRAGVQQPLASPTARAVLFSALTTGTAFGSLALSHHPGTASMGRLLLLSLGCTLLATLVFIPALLPKRSIDQE